MEILPSDPKKLNEVNNLLTDFLDFLADSQSGIGMFIYRKFPSYYLDGELVEAHQFGRLDKEDVADCLEALGLLSDRNQETSLKTFLYTHGFEKNGAIMPVMFNLMVLVKQGRCGVTINRVDF